MNVELIRTPEGTCVHCGRVIYLQGYWRHLVNLLRECPPDGRTSAQPPDTRPSVYACRWMETRSCPKVYDGPCGNRPCARYESDDETPWLLEVGA